MASKQNLHHLVAMHPWWVAQIWCNWTQPPSKYATKYKHEMIRHDELQVYTHWWRPVTNDAKFDLASGSMASAFLENPSIRQNPSHDTNSNASATPRTSSYSHWVNNLLLVPRVWCTSRARSSCTVHGFTAHFVFCAKRSEYVLLSTRWR